MADINNGKPLAFEQGGILTLTDGSDVWTVINRERGTLQVDEGGYQVVEWHDRGTPKLPREGSGIPSRIRLTLKLTKLESDSLADLSKKRAAAPGDVYPFDSMVIEFVLDKTPTAFSKREFTGVHFARPAVVREGQELDTVELEFLSTDPLGDDTGGAYVP